MRALVLGGNGFIGSHVVDKLLVDGHSVRVLDRSPEKYRQPLLDVDYRFASLDDVAALTSALDDIDIVYHFISSTVPSTSNTDPIFDIESNLVGTVRLLECMHKVGICRIVYLSSGGTVYGRSSISPIPETHALNPICSYGIVKLAVENYLHMFSELYGLSAVIIRASNPYGERQGHSGVQGVVGTFMNSLCSGRQVVIWGNGDIVRDFIYVKDLAELCVLAGASNIAGIYNGGTGHGLSVGEVYQAVLSVSGLSSQPIYEPGRCYDVSEVVLDTKLVTNTFGWEATTSFITGLKATWMWRNSI